MTAAPTSQDRTLVFRLAGLTCMDCAAHLERRVAAIPGVAWAHLNFYDAKLTVAGHFPTTAAIVEAVVHEASRENVVARLEGGEAPAPAASTGSHSRWTVAGSRPKALLLAASGVLLAAGWLAGWLLPSEQWMATLLYGLTIAVGGFPTARKGLRNLVRWRFDMNVLMTVAVAGAALLGQWQEGAVVAFLFHVAEVLETSAMAKTRNAIRALMDLAPPVARVRQGQEERTVPVTEVRVGDVVVVRPGEKIPVDGQVIGGTSSVNQAPITGESMPVAKGPGDEVFAGTLNGEGALEVAVTRPAADTTLARILHLVEEALAQRAPVQRFVDSFARYYTPAVMALATLIALIPPLVLGQPWGEWVYRGLAVLVVACPCALVVSTPVALVAGIASAARHGVLVKGGVYLEQAARIRAVALDKTGTLTRGRPVVTDVVPLIEGGGSGPSLLTLAAAVEQHSEHPLARAVVEAALRQGVAIPPAHDFQAMPGLGARAVVAGTRYYIGSPRLFARLGVGNSSAREVVARLEAEGKTVVILGTEAQVIGVLAVADELRESSAAALRELADLGVRHTVLLTGDNNRAAAAVAREAGVAEFRAELLPQDKLAAIHELRQRYGVVAMVGDGINDAPALAAATLGVAVGGAGNDVVLETAGAVLMAGDLSGLPFLLRLGRVTLGVIRQNIALSLALKLAAVAAAFGGWLTLWLAIVADMGATLLVTLNSLRLMRVRPPGATATPAASGLTGAAPPAATGQAWSGPAAAGNPETELPTVAGPAGAGAEAPTPVRLAGSRPPAPAGTPGPGCACQRGAARCRC